MTAAEAGMLVVVVGKSEEQKTAGFVQIAPGIGLAAGEQTFVAAVEIAESFVG